MHRWGDIIYNQVDNGKANVMMTSSNGNIFRFSGPLWGESTGDRGIPLTKASDTELWCFFDLILNKRLSKQSRRRWFDTPSCSLWRHCNGIINKMVAILQMAFSNTFFWNENLGNVTLIILGFVSKVPVANNPDSKVHWANMGPSWVLSAQGGPHVGPMNHAIMEVIGSGLAPHQRWQANVRTSYEQVPWHIYALGLKGLTHWGHQYTNCVWRSNSQYIGSDNGIVECRL